ncbi:DoxX family protein [Streptomyces albicerus]|uniref:DoxX family protein n=1 Tax=Streptomyces albicerus TaxID=2569859 RepID=UPI00124B86B5|nr:DoxX family protein [Streptomyces albicerus]
MFTAYVVVTVVTILVNAGIVVADLAKADFVVANSAEVGVPPSWLPPLAALKAAGAGGLLLGLLGVPALGIAAATGLVAFYLGAVITHVRARVFYNIAFPGAFLALAAASLTLSVTR